ncbi:MAG: flagellar assembly protein FliW [Planctomycetota bacterium]
MDEQTLAQEAATGEEPGAVTFPTRRFDEVTVSEDRILSFDRGLVGLPDTKRFVFLHAEGTPGPFFWMQSVDDPALAFVVTEPQLFFPDYKVVLGKAEQQELGIGRCEEGLVCVILVVPDDPSRISANLRGPIVINMERRVGIQLVLAGEEYPVKAALFPSAEEGGAECSC